MSFISANLHVGALASHRPDSVLGALEKNGPLGKALPLMLGPGASYSRYEESL